MEAGEYTRKQFMSEISSLTEQIVNAAKTFEESTLEAKTTSLTSPDGTAMVETLRNYQTPDGSFKVSKVIAGRMMEQPEVQELITKRFVGPISGFKSRLGRPFSAALKMDETSKVEFVFDNAPVGANGEKLDISNQESIGICPIDGGRVYETLMSCACENSFKETPTCTFKVGKKILSKEITKEMVLKLLTEKKTDLIPGFVSMRTRRPFSAFLKLGDDGKVSFEFPERTGPAKGGKGGRFPKKKA
jgi:DNA topoisomerase-3